MEHLLCARTVLGRGFRGLDKGDTVPTLSELQVHHTVTNSADSPEKQNQWGVCVHVCRGEGELFKKLAHAAVEISKYKICRVGWQLETQGKVAVVQVQRQFDG